MIRARKFTILALLLILSGLSLLPAQAQTGVAWSAELFNNTILQAPAALTRVDGSIAFDWGAGAPAPGINTDNFSIRWGADPFFNAGTYRFFVLADDAVRLFVDFQPVPLIDTVGQPRVGQIVSADISLTQGTHHIQLDYQEFGGSAYVYLTWANLAGNPNPSPNFPVPGGSGQPVAGGPWTAQYYPNTTLSGSPVLIQSESSPNHNWGTGSPVVSLPADNFSARWTSVQTIEAGAYQISVSADDGVRVYIDGVPYINQFNQATGQTYTATVTLAAGPRNFMIEYFEAAGVAFINYSFTRVGATVPTVTPALVTGPRLTVTGAFRLNVRATPDPINGAVLTRINRNETYPVLGRNANSSWWQINVRGTIGWVSGRFVTTFETTRVPVTSGSVVVPTATPVVTGCASAPLPRLTVGRLARVTPGLPNNIRTQPSTTSALVGQIPPGAVFSVIGGPQCAMGFYWWQVNYNGIVGWTPEGGSGQYWIEPAS